MLQVLLNDFEYSKDHVFSLAYVEQLSCKERLMQILHAMEDYYFDAPGGCLMVKIGLESAQVMPEFTKVIKIFFEDWIAAFSYIFQSQYDQEKSQLLADQAVQEIEGAIMLSALFLSFLKFGMIHVCLKRTSLIATMKLDEVIRVSSSI